jgi:hypothetical protein
MTAPITIAGSVDVWLTSTYDSLEKVLKTADRDAPEALSMLGYAAHDMSGGNYPWTRIGTAEVKVTFIPLNEATAAQIATLQRELDEERAKWLTAQQKILERINKLQALEMTVEA